MQQQRHHLIALAVFSLAASVQAQSSATASAPVASTEKLERIEVTGSSIKRVDKETASPVQILSAEDIARSGASSVADLMRLLPAVTGGGQVDSTSTSFSEGVATVSMRGLGSASTLTLINGRRMAATATANPNAGQSTLYNLNNIPLAAIERVEVLKDGASAVYGSDAIAGVVNFILKKEYQGLEGKLSTSGATSGGFTSSTASLFGGFGDLVQQRFNVMVGLDLSRRGETPVSRLDGISYEEWQLASTSATTGLPGDIYRPDSAITFAPNFWRETGVGTGAYNTTTPLVPKSCPAPSQLSTTILANGAPACAMDTSIYERFTDPSKSAKLFARGNFWISEDLSASVEAAFSRIENSYVSSSGFATLGSGLSEWFDPKGNRRTFRHVMAANHPDNPLFQADPNNKLRVLTSARLGDIPRDSRVNQDDVRLVLDLSGSHFGWDWNGGGLYNKSKREEVETGMIHSLKAQAALDKYRFGGQNSPELLAQISPTSTNTGETKVSILNFKGSREIGRLAGGMAGLALGLEHRRESISMIPDADLDAGNFVGRGGSKANGSRQVSSAFAEVVAPVLQSLSLEAAVRVDKYSDFGNSTTPKLGFKWTPMKTFAVRGTAASGFRAPSLSQMSESSVTSFQSIGTWRDALRCPLGTDGLPAKIPGATGYDSQLANECNRNASSGNSRTIAAFIVANPALRPETSRSYTLGLVFAPFDSLNGTFDVYQITRKNEVDRLSSSDVLQRLYENGDLSYANDVIRSADSTTALKDAQGKVIPGTERIALVKRKYLNLGQTQVRGADLELTHRATFENGGRLNSSLFLGYVHSYRFQRDKGLPMVDINDSMADDLPKYKARVNASYKLDKVTVTAAVNYLHSMGLPRYNTLTGVRDTCNPSYAASANQMAALGGDCRVASLTTLDLGMGVQLTKGLNVRATVLNVFDKKAPYSPTFDLYGWDKGQHSAAGQSLSLSASYSFK
ncbi:TonB-dependent receptor plug domain-containing protein [Kinneretia aquatilis]|uniref:TonB-dependent receptor plug domain-containing protein n=1 Tax=Kinneretia aquatilis TaxID=2070761 RepID=UPI0013FD14C0|nr:TonB-dependent receptor [Paucibacter aquatile]